ncbi:MAG: hypothetical protein ACYC5O_16580 [Anaerolineae bacterium]
MRATADAGSTRGRARRVAFVALAATLSVLFGITFAAVTALTIGIWLDDPGYTETTPVGDLSFFALGAIIIAVGFATQLRRPERKIAGAQQAVIGLLALAAAGLVGDRIEPLVGGLIGLAAAAILVALHPARRESFRFGKGLSAPLAVMSAAAAIPAVGYAAHVLALARDAGPSCFMGQCARGDRLAEMAASAIAIVLVGMLAALKPHGWRVPAWGTGAAAAIVGLASIALPNAPGAVGQVWGALVVAWGVLFVGLAEWEARHTPDLS